MTPEVRAAELCYEHLGAVPLAVIATAIRDAEARGAVAERENLSDRLERLVDWGETNPPAILLRMLRHELHRIRAGEPT